MRRLNLSGRTAGGVITVALLLPTLLFGAFMRESVNAELHVGDRAERVRSAEVGAALIREVVGAAGNELTLLSTRQLLRAALRERDRTDLARHLQDMRSTFSRYNSAAAFDPAGVMLARDPDDVVVGQSFADRDYFRGAMASESWYVSEAFLSRATPPRPLVAVALAIRENGAVIGVMQVTMTAEALIELIAPLQTVGGREIVILDRSRAVLASTGVGRALEALPGVVMPAGQRGSLDTSIDGAERLLTQVPIPETQWDLLVIDDPALALAPVERLEAVMLTALIVTALVLVGVGIASGWLYGQVQRANAQIEASLRAQEEANADLRRLDRAKSEFVSIVSHEFRTPLTGILGFSELLRDEQLSPEDVKEYASDVHRDASRLARLVNDMLDLDRMRSGRMTLTRRPVKLNEIVREVAATAPGATPGHEVTLDLDEGDPIVAADRDRLVQVVMNLFSNAAKYSPDGGRIRLRTAMDDGSALLSVSDEGMGIPAEAVATIFDRFTRADNAALRGIGGTGLGLPITKEIVEMHGGRVWLESEVGRGSTFHVALPLERAEAAAS